MRGIEIREHITTLASATPHPSLSSDSGHQGDEWLRLMGNSPGGSRQRRHGQVQLPQLLQQRLWAQGQGVSRWAGGGHGGEKSWREAWRRGENNTNNSQYLLNSLHWMLC